MLGRGLNGKGSGGALAFHRVHTVCWFSEKCNIEVVPVSVQLYNILMNYFMTLHKMKRDTVRVRI